MQSNHSHAYKQSFKNLHKESLIVNFCASNADVFILKLMIFLTWSCWSYFTLTTKNQIERKLLWQIPVVRKINWICTTSIVYVNKFGINWNRKKNTNNQIRRDSKNIKGVSKNLHNFFLCWRLYTERREGKKTRV